MTDFFIGQISMFAFDFPPRFWAQCNGQLLPIAQNAALFSLLGTQYGGNGTTNFALPDLRGRTPIGYASSVNPAWQPPAVQIGQASGQESVTLSATNSPTHTHSLNATTTVANKRVPTGKLFGTDSASIADYYAVPGTNTTLNPSSVSSVGQGQAHANMQPYSVINFCVAISGIFPSRN